MEKVCVTCARLDGCRIMDMLSEDGEMRTDEMFCSSWEEINTQKTFDEVKAVIESIEGWISHSKDPAAIQQGAERAPMQLRRALKKHAKHMARKSEAEDEQDSKNTARKSS